jgi:GNAT superfamily N-acetyltransferase
MATVPFRVRPWRAGDERLLARCAADISAASLRSRFFAGVPRLPATYLRYISSAPRCEWDAQVALCGRRLIGWAEFARAGSPAEADVAMVVVDGWQRRGVGTALVHSMLPRIAGAGVKILHADVELGNEPARRLMGAVLGPVPGLDPPPAGPGSGSGSGGRLSAKIADGLLHYMVRLDGQP